MYNAYLIGVGLLIALALPVYWYYRRHARSHKAKLLFACKFALDNYDRLVSPKLEVITEIRLRAALRTAATEDAAIIKFIIANMPTLGHVIDTYEETAIGGNSSMGPIVTTVTCYIYGISKNDMENLSRRLRA